MLLTFPLLVQCRLSCAEDLAKMKCPLLKYRQASVASVALARHSCAALLTLTFSADHESFAVLPSHQSNGPVLGAPCYCHKTNASESVQILESNVSNKYSFSCFLSVFCDLTVYLWI